jgi:hypothetical protein
MHKKTTTTTPHEDISMINNILNQSTKSDGSSSFSNIKIRNIIKEEQQTRTTIYPKKPNGIRAKSADYPRRTPPVVSSSSSKTRSTMIYEDELYRIKNEDEKRGLTKLNNRFANYLNKIKNLADINIKLRHEIDDIHKEYMKYNEGEKLEIQCNDVRRQLNNELQKLISSQIRLQRADHDKKFYKNKLKLFSTSEQSHSIKQQLDANLYELNCLKEQYEKQNKDLQVKRFSILFIYFDNSHLS